jgi:alkanesulfonate monooxygenase SsuD/methylene tetrahydromethanopterin reductase-like flavin-dependent oxidoreductase (luciferase family)
MLTGPPPKFHETRDILGSQSRSRGVGRPGIVSATANKFEFSAVGLCDAGAVEVGVHLPQLALGTAPVSMERVAAVVDAACALGFAAISANDHFTFSRPWLDGLTLLAAVAERAGGMDLVTSVGLPSLRGPVPYAAAMSTLATLSQGRVIAGIGPGSSREDYVLTGIAWEERWQRFEEVSRVLRARFDGGSPRVELWLASWGSAAGMRRVARYGDGWLASAYHSSPAEFGFARALVTDELARLGRSIEGFGHALVTMWTWITDDPRDAERMLGVLSFALGRSPDSLRDRVCVGSAEKCVALLREYAAHGCRRVHFWPLGDEPGQLTRLAHDVLPQVVL